MEEIGGLTVARRPKRKENDLPPLFPPLAWVSSLLVVSLSLLFEDSARRTASSTILSKEAQSMAYTDSGTVIPEEPGPSGVAITAKI